MSETQDVLNECKASADQVFGAAPKEQPARDAAIYLAHTARGESIRRIADAIGTHPSTVSRAVRRVEQRRDDPLFDRLITEAEASADPAALDAAVANGNTRPALDVEVRPMAPDRLKREAKRFLRRLCEPGAFMLIAHGAQRAGVFCAANQHARPIAMVPIEVAAEFLRQEWIGAAARGTASVRYRITDVGRSYLRRTLSEDQSVRAEGFAESVTPFQRQHQEMGEKLFANPLSGEAESRPVNLGESPIGWLTRRKGADGKPFLKPEEIDAAERLRTDFELAQIGPSVAQDWRKFLTPGDRLSGSPRSGDPGEGAMAARDRVMKALAALGPGLSDVAFRTCCFLEGLEACERRMGWSARSGKVVLQLALQRLAQHYGLIVFPD